MYIGIDIGGTWAKVAWRVGREGPIRFSRVAADLLADPNGWFERLRAALPTAARKALESGRLRGIAIGVPGEVKEPGIVVQSPNLPRWRGVPIGPQLQQLLDVPVWVENDANMAAVALGAHPEWVGGDVRNLFVLTLGTGVGGGWLLEGKLYRRPPGGEAEIGHGPVVPGGRRCACGRHGCLEAYAGGRAMLAIYAERTGEELAAVDELATRADVGDPVAQAVFTEAADALGRACAWVTNLIATGRFVFVGGVAGAHRWLRKPLRARYRELAFPTWARKTRFYFPARRERIGVLGALYAAESEGGYRFPIS